MSLWKQKWVYDSNNRTIIELTIGVIKLLSVVIIDQIRRKDQHEDERSRPMLRIEPEHPTHPEETTVQESCTEESNRGIAIIDFSI